jgi:hypothetical protein
VPYQRLLVNVGQLQDLLAAYDEASFGVCLVGREGRPGRRRCRPQGGSAARQDAAPVRGKGVRVEATIRRANDQLGKYTGSSVASIYLNSVDVLLGNSVSRRELGFCCGTSDLAGTISGCCCRLPTACSVFRAEGLRIITTLPRTPRMNAICERVIGTLRRGLLDRDLDPRRTSPGLGAPRVREPLQRLQAASVPAAAAPGIEAQPAGDVADLRSARRKPSSSD